MTRIVGGRRTTAATICEIGGAPTRNARRLRRFAAVAALLAVSVLGGCSYIFSEKRTAYQYEPVYGVDSPELLRTLDGLGTEMVPGNSARLLQNGDRIFPAMLDAIAAARLSINLENYIFDHGTIATQFAAALAERARAGVAVRPLVDGWGSNLGPLKEELEAAGAVVRVYKPLKIYAIDAVGHRTHRRILTVDGRVGFCGGVGIDDRWKGDARDPSEWRDTMIEMEGPVVVQLQHIFAQDWIHTTGEVLNGERQFPVVEPAGSLVALYISFESPLSGMSMNPARTIASAAPGMLWQSLWIYLTAPVLGMLGGAQLFLALRGARRLACAKLLHPAEARCIHCGYQPAGLETRPSGVQQVPEN